VKWKDGVYLGVRAASGEVIVGLEEGVFRTRTVKRKPVESRCLQLNSSLIGGVPWKESEEDDGDGPPRKGVIELDAKVMEEDAEEVIKTSPVVPRNSSDYEEGFVRARIHRWLSWMQGYAQRNG